MRHRVPSLLVLSCYHAGFRTLLYPKLGLHVEISDSLWRSADKLVQQQHKGSDKYDKADTSCRSMNFPSWENTAKETCMKYQALEIETAIWKQTIRYLQQKGLFYVFIPNVFEHLLCARHFSGPGEMAVTKLEAPVLMMPILKFVWIEKDKWSLALGSNEGNLIF